MRAFSNFPDYIFKIYLLTSAKVMKHYGSQYLDLRPLDGSILLLVRRSIGRTFFLWLALGVFLAGCTTEYNLATQRQESLLYGTEKEIKIGEAVSHQIEQEYKVIHDLDVNERLERILERLVEVSDRHDLVYFIKALEDDLINAVSLPGGYIYVFKGLLDKVKSDDELAGVIAHELGHITAKHGIKRVQSSYGALLAQILATQTNANVAGGVQLALARCLWNTLRRMNMRRTG